MFAIVASLVGQGNVLTVPRTFIDVVGGDLHTALFLSQVIYWSDKGKKTAFYKTDKEFREELGFTDYRFRQAKKTLKKLGFVETSLKRVDNAPTTHYIVNDEKIVEAISRFVEGQRPDLLRVNETESAKVNESITETTTETTTNSTGDKKTPPVPPALSKQKPPTPAKAKPNAEPSKDGRTHNEMKTFLVEVMGLNQDDITSWGPYNEASKLLRKVNATDDEIKASHRYCRKNFDQYTVSAIPKYIATIRASRRSTLPDDNDELFTPPSLAVTAPTYERKVQD